MQKKPGCISISSGAIPFYALKHFTHAMYKRVDIKTGFICNNNCRFCVQAHKKHLGNRSTAEIKRDLKEAYENGCEGVVFTGGEVTIRKDLLQLVAFARQLGFRRIQLQSNCRMLHYKEYCKKLVKAGVNEFGPAVHGHIASLHDYLTRSEGSFFQTTKAISNLKELKQTILVNTVVVKPNYRYLPQLARLLCDLKVDQFQFAFMHAVGNAMKNYDQMMPWISLAAPYIMEGLQTGIDNGIKVMAEAMPMCTMKGYEKYCSEYFIPDTELRDIGSVDPDFTNTRRTEGKVKFEQCKGCKYDSVCEGPWREYPERRGDWEFQPVSA
jgi:MoaA/NifB/PqqE/SkfB family radical SAM enzyme